MTPECVSVGSCVTARFGFMLSMVTPSILMRGSQKKKRYGMGYFYGRASVLSCLSALILTSHSLSFAQTSQNIPIETQDIESADGVVNTQSLPDLTLDLGLNQNLINIPLESVGSGFFRLNPAKADCVLGQSQCIRGLTGSGLGANSFGTNSLGTNSFGLNDFDLDYAEPISHFNQTGLDLELTPRAAVRFDDESTSALLGALVRIGGDLDQTRNTSSWYVFAGADAEAVNYSSDTVNRFANGQFNLQSQIIVGDAQAGVGYRIGDADISLGYIRRQATSDDVQFKEDAAALSFTWRR